jgi:putative cardiolipin synthase
MPVGEKRLGFHAKLMLADNDVVYVGSCNLDARSLRINTETGLIVRSSNLNQALRLLLECDFDPRNAWEVRMAPDGTPRWHAQGELRDQPPSDSLIQCLEDWFIGLLPIDQQL